MSDEWDADWRYQAWRDRERRQTNALLVLAAKCLPMHRRRNMVTRILDFPYPSVEQERAARQAVRRFRYRDSRNGNRQ